jgi:ubiquinol-cytochrome c reductase iron-sulfur subunit
MSLPRRLAEAVVVLALIARGRRGRRREEEPVDEGGPEEGRPFLREVGARPGAERAVAALLFASALASVAFVVVFFTGADTQALGIALAAALGLLGAALAVAAAAVVPREQAIERRPRLAHPEAEPPVRRRLATAGEGVSRRRLLGTAGLAAGATLTGALVVPAASLGPAVGNSIAETPWRRGRRLVDEDGRPLLAADVPATSFLTAFPEGADPRELGAPVIVVREDPARLRLPRARRGWAPQGILAYSKICTHAGCALALYRRPLYEPVSQPPGIACPCHYSVFDPRTGGTVLAGPAGRPLPQLPLAVGPDGELRAAGGFSGPIGPSWWGVRET